jgi:hypothetical protein
MDIKTNWCTKPNAEALAQRIRSYWHAKGYEVAVRVESEGGNWVVRSDMNRGFPRTRLNTAKGGAIT